MDKRKKTAAAMGRAVLAAGTALYLCSCAVPQIEGRRIRRRRGWTLDLNLRGRTAMTRRIRRWWWAGTRGRAR